MSTSESNREGAGKPSLYLTSYLVHTNVADISTTRFDSLNPAEHNILNDIKHITLYAQKSNYHSIPTDCPTVSKSHTDKQTRSASFCLYLPKGPCLVCSVLG